MYANMNANTAIDLLHGPIGANANAMEQTGILSFLHKIRAR